MKEDGEKAFFSKFLCEKVRGSDVVIFNSLNPHPAVGTSLGNWEHFKFCVEDHRLTPLWADLKKKGLLINSPEEDFSMLADIREKFLKTIPPVPSTLYLVLTQECNLKCTYCPFPRIDYLRKTPRKMSSEIAKKGIDFWARGLGELRSSEYPGYIIFYGGEPLLNRDVLECSLDYIKDLKSVRKIPNEVRLLLDTNGTILSDETASLLKSHDVEVTVALDEFSGKNDICRKDKEGNGTFERVVETLDRLRMVGIKTYLSTSLTPFTSLEEIATTVEKYSIMGIGVNMLRGEIPQELFGAEGIDAEAYRMNCATDLVNLWQQKGKKVAEFQTQRRASAFQLRNFHTCSCGGFGEHVVIQPDGEIGNCPWTDTYNMGDLDHNLFYSSIKGANFLSKRKESLPLFNNNCLKCEAISICGGGCVWADDELGKKDESGCLLSKQMLDFLVWNNYQRIE